MENFDYEKLKHLREYMELYDIVKNIMSKIITKKKNKKECIMTLKTAQDTLKDIKDKNLMLSNNDV